MNIEDKIISESYKLSNSYYKYYIKKYPRNKFQVYNKYKDYFIKASSMFCVRDYYNPEKLITSFMMDGFKFPQQLPNEKVWKTYLEYLPNIKEEKPDYIIEAENIVSGWMEIKRNGGVEEFLNKKINQLMLFNNALKFDPLILYFSKTFEEFYNNNYSNFKVELDFDKQRNRIFSLSENSDKLLDKIKKILDNDYKDN